MKPGFEVLRNKFLCDHDGAHGTGSTCTKCEMPNNLDQFFLLYTILNDVVQVKPQLVGRFKAIKAATVPRRGSRREMVFPVNGEVKLAME